MDTKKSPEHRVREKIGLILLVVILFFTGLFIYSFFLKRNMDAWKTEMDRSYDVLSKSNQLIISIQQAQEVLNLYLATPRRKLQQQYDSLANNISRQIQDIQSMKSEKEQNLLLEDIDSLLREKNRMVRKLTLLFRSRNPLSELDERINRYDGVILDSVIVTTNMDTTRLEKQKKGFWNRLRHLVDPEAVPDSTISIARTEQEMKAVSRVDTSKYADLKNITEEVSKTYSSQIEGIEREVRELLFAEQSISIHISQLTNEFSNETIDIAWYGAESGEILTLRIFRFAIIIGTLSIFFILIIIFFIAGDLNKGQQARTDLVKEKQLTEELIESRHKLLLSVSHDVKTPLSSMMGYMEMWDAEETDENKKRQLQSARSSGKYILNMLTNLLEFSRLQQKSAKLHFSRFNLIELMDDIIRMFQPFTEEKSLSLKFCNLASSPLYIEADHTLLKQILSNVISNAVKYTLRGGVTIRLQHQDQLIFTITDSGTGMDVEELPEIFKPFSRMQSPLNVEGSGFGMYVTKGLVDLLKGRIEVTSEKGKGTCVTITLPARQVSGNDTPAACSGSPVVSGINNSIPEEMQCHKILLFEDDLSLGNMIREYLVHNGYKVKLCNKPQDVNGFLRVISLFDIVFTDMQMTNVTGTDILREIREIDNHIPVWLMTAHGDYTSERAHSEGFSGLIRKPIQMSKLLEIVSGEQYPQSSKQASAEASLRNKFPQLVSLFGGDTQTIKDILSGYVQSSHQDMERLQKFIENGTFKEAQQLCHKIYPFICQLDADHLCTALRKMDQLRGEDETTYPDWKEELSSNIRQLRGFTEMIRKEYL